MDPRILLLVFTISHVCHCLAVAPKIKLNDDREIPSLGLGTWLGFTKAGSRVDVTNTDVEQAVEWAIDAGYRHIDTAAIYKTEPQVGRAINKKISEGVIKREDVFVTTKLWNDRHARQSVLPALEESLEQLNLSYVDLYLIHWPVSFARQPNKSNFTLDDTDYVETWRGMIEARDQGFARSIGVSNFNQNQLERLISLTSVKPAVLQVEINLNLQQPELLAYCKQQDIAVTGYTPFGSLFGSRGADEAPGPHVDDQALVAIATKYNKTVPQVALRYELDLGVIPIPKSTTKSRIEQNIDVFDFQLTEEDRNILRSYDRNYRVIPVRHFLQSPYYPFERN